MNVLPTLRAACLPSPSRAPEAVCAVGKANASRMLDGEGGGEEGSRRSARGDRRNAALSHIGTAETAPLWNGPPLRPAFVAQVLGQVMMDRGTLARDLAPAAYRERGAQVARGALFHGDV